MTQQQKQASNMAMQKHMADAYERELAKARAEEEQLREERNALRRRLLEEEAEEARRAAKAKADREAREAARLEAEDAERKAREAEIKAEKEAFYQAQLAKLREGEEISSKNVYQAREARKTRVLEAKNRAAQKKAAVDEHRRRREEAAAARRAQFEANESYRDKVYNWHKAQVKSQAEAHAIMTSGHIATVLARRDELEQQRRESAQRKDRERSEAARKKREAQLAAKREKLRASLKLDEERAAAAAAERKRQEEMEHLQKLALVDAYNDRVARLEAARTERESVLSAYRANEDTFNKRRREIIHSMQTKHDFSLEEMEAAIDELDSYMQTEMDARQSEFERVQSVAAAKAAAEEEQARARKSRMQELKSMAGSSTLGDSAPLVDPATAPDASAKKKKKRRRKKHHHHHSSTATPDQKVRVY